MATTDEVKGGLVKSGQSKDFPTMLKLYEDEVKRALPKHLKDNVDRYARLALTQFRQNPKLAQCDPRSVFACVILSTQLGLELGTMGQAYIVPYRTKNGGFEAQFVPGWRGYVDLVHRSGRAIVWTGAVFEGDGFEYRQGSSPFVNHIQGDEDDEAKITHFYAVGHVTGIEWPIVEVWSNKKVQKHLKKVNKVGDAHYAHKNWEMYGRKVVLLQAIKYLPASVDANRLASLDAEFDAGRPQGLSLDGAMDGIFHGDGAIDIGDTAPNGKEREAQDTQEKTVSDDERKAMDERRAKVEQEFQAKEEAKRKASEEAAAKKAEDQRRKAEETKKAKEKREEAEKEAATKTTPEPATQQQPLIEEPVNGIDDLSDLAEDDEPSTDASPLADDAAEAIADLNKFSVEAKRLNMNGQQAAQALFGISVDDLTMEQIVEGTKKMEGSSKVIRSIFFDLDVTDGDKPTPDDIKALEAEAKRLKVSPKKTAKTWLSVELESLNQKAVLGLIAAMKAYSS